MKHLLSALPLVIAMTGCLPDESLSGYADPASSYRLTQISGTPFAARAVIRFPAAGQVAGAGPCNDFSAPQTAPYPWFQMGPARMTRRACPDLKAETDFMQALGRMTQAEVLGGTLILSNEAGEEMVFVTEATDAQ